MDKRKQAEIVTNVNRDNLHDKIAIAESYGVYTGLIPPIKEFEQWEDFINPVIHYIPIDTNTGSKEMSSDIWKQKSWPGFEFKTSLLKKIFSAINGEIREQTEFEDLKDEKQRIWTYNTVVSFQGRSRLETVSHSKKVQVPTGLLDEYFHSKNRSKALNGAIRKCFIYKGQFSIKELQNGLIVVRFLLNPNTSNEAMSKAIWSNIYASYGLLGANIPAPEPPITTVVDETYSHDEMEEDDMSHLDEDEPEDYYEPSDVEMSTIPDVDDSGPIEEPEEINPYFKTDNPKFWASIKELEWSEDDRKQFLRDNFNVDSLKKLTHEQFEKAFDIVERYKKQNTQTDKTDNELDDNFDEKQASIDMRTDFRKAAKHGDEEVFENVKKYKPIFSKMTKNTQNAVLNYFKVNKIPVTREDLE